MASTTVQAKVVLWVMSFLFIITVQLDDLPGLALTQASLDRVLDDDRMNG